MDLIFIFTISALLLSVVIHAEVYSSIYQIEKILDTEAVLLEYLGVLIEAENKKDRTLPNMVVEFYKKCKKENDKRYNDNDYVGNPINDFHIINRYTNGWTKVIPEHLLCAECPISENIVDFYVAYKSILRGMDEQPTIDDLENTADAISRLSEMYDLDLADVFAGRIKGTQTDPLELPEIEFIIDVLHNRDMFEDESYWLQSVIETFNNGRITVLISEQKRFYRKLGRAFYMAGIPEYAVDWLTQYTEKAPDDKNMTAELNWYMTLDNDDLGRVCTGYDTTKFIDEINPDYISLCNGEELRAPSQTAKLRCFLRKTRIPYMWAKEEVMNFDPRVSLYYDVISDNESAIVRSLAKSQLGRSLVEASAGESEYGRVRISQTAWLVDGSHPVISKLSRRIETLTGLNLAEKEHVSDCEPLQVLNYGVGGLYSPHHDYLEETADTGNVAHDLLDSGDRLATWLFYLSDVKYGGATVYPRLKVRVPVTKGAAAFWYNIKKNGDVDDRTIHAACPVLVGSKWVSNKWIRSNGQFNTRPCGASYEDTVHE